MMVEESFLTTWERVIKKLPMPNDLVVVLNRDPDEAGDYRVMRHCEAVNNPDWTIMHDMVPSDLD